MKKDKINVAVFGLNVFLKIKVNAVYTFRNHRFLYN